MVKKNIILFLLPLFLISCATVPPPVYREMRRIHLGKFVNNTYEAGLSSLLREKLVELAPQWGIRIGEGGETLEGIIDEVDYTPLLYDEERRIKGVRVYLRLRVELREGGRSIWQKNLDVSTVYFQEEGKEKGLERVTEKAVRRIFLYLRNEGTGRKS